MACGINRPNEVSSHNVRNTERIVNELWDNPWYPPIMIKQTKLNNDISINSKLEKQENTKICTVCALPVADYVAKNASLSQIIKDNQNNKLNVYDPRQLQQCMLCLI